MTIRIIGAILIMIGCSGAGFMMAHSYRKEIAVLSDFADFLNTLECELQYRSPPISHILRDFASDKKGALFSFFRQLAKELESQVRPSVDSCVNATLVKETDLPKYTLNYIKKLGESLGCFDLNGQLLEIRALRNDVLDQITLLKNNQDAQTKNYKTIGICAGAALAILFV